jgi:hypothetical protein
VTCDPPRPSDYNNPIQPLTMGWLTTVKGWAIIGHRQIPAGKVHRAAPFGGRGFRCSPDGKRSKLRCPPRLPRPLGRAIGGLEAGDVQVEGLLSVPVLLSGGDTTRACASGAALGPRHARDGWRLGAPPPLRVRAAGGVTHGLSVAMLASRSDEASMSSSVSSVESGEKYPWRPERVRRGAALGAWRGGGMRGAGASG